MYLLSKQITDDLEKNGIVQTADKSLYIYGFHQLWVTILNLITAMAIGLMTRMLWQGLLFLVIYISLRRFAGGYHAKTEVGCYILSTLLLSAALYAIHAINSVDHIALLVLLLLAASSVIAFLSPVDTPNKPLDEMEIIVYRKQSQLMLFLHWSAFFFALIAVKEIAVIVAVADVVLAGMLISGFFNNKFHKNR